MATGLALAACGGTDDEGAVSSTAPPGDSPATTAATAATAPVIDPGDGGAYAVSIDPAAFSSVIDHPFAPKLPGTVWVYEARSSDGEVETIRVEVLDERRTIMGVETIVVHDVVTTADGTLVEDTFDWFAQDAGGNVWYFGEDTTSYDGGVASSDGAWEAGVDGALPGIVMPAEPAVSELGYRQEYLPGEAEDMGQVIATSGSATVPAGDFTDVLMTRDWTPLEPDVVEEKTYARGVGLVLESKVSGDGGDATVELIEHVAPG